MDRCLRIAYRYHDDDIVEFEVSAWNGSFGGSTCLYIGQGELADVADRLTGFPSHLQDNREISLGAFGTEFAGGAAKIQFSCNGGAGHCELGLTIEADYKNRTSHAERVELNSAIEPAALDEFVTQLRLLNRSLSGSAVLVFA
jgi:hypothetical protein